MNDIFRVLNKYMTYMQTAKLIHNSHYSLNVNVRNKPYPNFFNQLALNQDLSIKYPNENGGMQTKL